MSEEQNQGKNINEQEGKQSKRKRMPSQYASQIADFKSNYSTNNKRVRPSKTPENVEVVLPQSRSTAGKPLTCLLPSGKQLFLRVVVKPCKNGKIEKVDKKKTKISTQSPPPISKPKQQKPKDMSVTLLDKFLSVVQQIQKKSEVEPRDLREMSKQNEDVRRRSEKFIRERQQKWTKCSQRWKMLSDRLDKLAENYIYLN